MFIIKYVNFSQKFSKLEFDAIARLSDLRKIF